MATLPGVCRHKVSTGTGRPRVSIMWLGMRPKAWSTRSISVWQHAGLFEQIRGRDTLTYWVDARKPKNQESLIPQFYLSVAEWVIEREGGGREWGCTKKSYSPHFLSLSMFNYQMVAWLICSLPPLTLDPNIDYERTCGRDETLLFCFSVA